FSPFYADIHLVVNWFDHGAEIKNRISEITGKPKSNVWMLRKAEQEIFYQPGLTYPRRLHRLAVAPLPAGCIISVRASGIYSDPAYLLETAGLCSSGAFDFLVKLMLGRFGHPQFDNGTIGLTPVPDGFPEYGRSLREPTAE